MSETLRYGGQNRRRRPTSLPTALCDNGFASRVLAFLRVSIVLFEILLQAYLSAERQAGKLRPLVAKMQHFAHLIEELCICIVVPPAPGIASSMKFRCRRSTKVR